MGCRHEGRSWLLVYMLRLRRRVYETLRMGLRLWAMVLRCIVAWRVRIGMLRFKFARITRDGIIVVAVVVIVVVVASVVGTSATMEATASDEATVVAALRVAIRVALERREREV
jgi:hypothetical protein